jgi:Zn-dependent peptidase ImmA (M78 family)
MDWTTAHREAMVAAFEAHEDLDLNTFGRVDVFDAIAAAGLRLSFRPLTAAAGLYVAARLDSAPGAIINARHPLAMQRYTGAHEYGHHVFGHGEQVDCHEEPRGRGASLPPFEKLAEAFAAWFLMPPEAAEYAMEQLGRTRPCSAVDAYQLALRLGTSYLATCVHLPSLKLAKDRVADGWRDSPLKAVKQELSQTPPPGGWHSDIWVLTERDADVPIVARNGDLLLVELPGWDITALPPGATAELIPPIDLLSTPRWAIALSPDMLAGPASLELVDAGSTLRFSLIVERPRFGRYVTNRKVLP